MDKLEWDSLNTNIAERIRLLRNDIPYTQKELADAAGIPVSTLAQIERGDISPSLDVLRRIARSIGVPASILIEADLELEDRRELGVLAFQDILEDVFETVKMERGNEKIQYVCVSSGKEYRLDYYVFLEMYETSKALIKALILSSIRPENVS